MQIFKNCSCECSILEVSMNNRQIWIILFVSQITNANKHLLKHIVQGTIAIVLKHLRNNTEHFP